MLKCHELDTDAGPRELSPSRSGRATVRTCRGAVTSVRSVTSLEERVEDLEVHKLDPNVSHRRQQQVPAHEEVDGFHRSAVTSGYKPLQAVTSGFKHSCKRSEAV